MICGVLLLVATTTIAAMGPGSVAHAALGANGKIAFSSSHTGNIEIFAVNADGTNLTRLTNDGGAGPHPAWSADQNPEWSPDGTRIAFDSSRSGDFRLWVMDADGGNMKQLTADHPTETQQAPAWSPDGMKIAFEGASAGRTDVWIMNADGSNPVKLTGAIPSGAHNPAWSADGRRIAFEGGPGPDVWVINVDGSNPVDLTANVGISISEPAWSPLGPEIAVAWVEDVSTTGIANLWVMNVDSREMRRVTDVAMPRTGFGYPAWSPDGSQLASNGMGGNVYVMGIDGTDARRVTNTGEVVGAPDWQPVGGPNPPGVAVESFGVVDPATGIWHLRGLHSGEVSTFYYGNPGDYPFMGDWDCDGVDTPGLYRQSDGYAYLRNSNTQGVADLTFFFGNPGDVPIAGDFNGNGCDTLSIYRPSEARFYIINQLGQNGGGLGAADYSFLFGDAGDKPVVGDWDGDGIDEIGLHRESTGFFYYRNSLTTGIADGQFYFGDPGDRFVAGDWGIVDGADTPGLFRPSNLTFYFRHTLTQGNADSQFTWTGAGTDWLPIAGNFGLS